MREEEFRIRSSEQVTALKHGLLKKFRLPDSATVDSLMQGAMLLDDDCKALEEYGLDPKRNIVVVIRGVSQAP